MFENKIPANSIVGHPRGIVLLNGIPAIFTRIEVNTATYFVADTFTADIPIGGQSSAITPDYISSQPAIMVEIYAGFPSDPNNYNQDNLKRIFMGQVDSIEIDWIRKQYVLTGRDLSAKFIDNKTTQKYPNLTASQIVELLAKKEGLTADVTPTTTPAGYFYSDNHTTLSAEQPEWDLITYLAQQENFVAYVDGTTLHFHPAPQDTDTPYLIQVTGVAPNTGNYSGNFINLNTTRSLTIARDIIVIVRSWNYQQKKGFNVRVRAVPNKKVALASKAQPIGDAQVFTYVVDGLTREQAIQKAQQIAKKLSQHERRIEIDLPADTILKKVGVIKLQGTNTSFDQVYFTSSINRVLSSDISEGFKMRVEAKNHSPNSQVIF